MCILWCARARGEASTGLKRQFGSDILADDPLGLNFYVLPKSFLVLDDLTPLIPLLEVDGKNQSLA